GRDLAHTKGFEVGRSEVRTRQQRAARGGAGAWKPGAPTQCAASAEEPQARTDSARTIELGRSGVADLLDGGPLGERLVHEAFGDVGAAAGEVARDDQRVQRASLDGSLGRLSAETSATRRARGLEDFIHELAL